MIDPMLKEFGYELGEVLSKKDISTKRLECNNKMRTLGYETPSTVYYFHDPLSHFSTGSMRLSFDKDMNEIYHKLYKMDIYNQKIPTYKVGTEGLEQTGEMGIPLVRGSKDSPGQKGDDFDIDKPLTENEKFQVMSAYGKNFEDFLMKSSKMIIPDITKDKPVANTGIPGKGGEKFTVKFSKDMFNAVRFPTVTPDNPSEYALAMLANGLHIYKDGEWRELPLKPEEAFVSKTNVETKLGDRYTDSVNEKNYIYEGFWVESYKSIENMPDAILSLNKDVRRTYVPEELGTFCLCPDTNKFYEWKGRWVEFFEFEVELKEHPGYKVFRDKVKEGKCELGIDNPQLKESEGKLPYELEWGFIEGMAKRMQANKGKYEPYNWKNNKIPVHKLKEALSRHFIEVQKGNYDDEGLYGHLYALACNSMMIIEQLKMKAV